MPITVDLTGVSTEGPAPLEPDIYSAVITKADIRPSKSSGENTIYLDLAVGEEGRTLRWQSSLQSQALWRFKSLLVTLGFDVPEGPFEFDEQELIGMDCRVRTILEPHYKDPERKTTRIAEILSADETADSSSWG